jgi:hypothetical protein
MLAHGWTSTGRTMAILVVAAAAAGTASLLIHIDRRTEEARGGLDAGPRPMSPPASSGDTAQPPPVQIENIPEPRIEEQRALAPRGEDAEEISRRDFESSGGIDTPGTDPERARRDVRSTSWATRTRDDLRAGLDELVGGEGVTVTRVECARGRCLVELRFGDMIRALDRVEPLRTWASERVPCRVYSDGPDEGESPSEPPTQQIWVLCGEPEGGDR